MMPHRRKNQRAFRLRGYDEANRDLIGLRLAYMLDGVLRMASIEVPWVEDRKKRADSIRGGWAMLKAHRREEWEHGPSETWPVNQPVDTDVSLP